jgi:hypothetical protein
MIDNTKIISNVKDTFLHQIRDQLYYVEIYLHHQSDDSEAFPVPFFFVDTLCFEETLMDWYVKGFIILNDEFEIFQKNSPDSGKPPIVFRTDGRNRISFNIVPLVKENSSLDMFTGEIRNTDEEFRKKWQMSFDCVIYDIEDLDTGENQKKKRKLYFWDERFQILSEKNIEWSTNIEGMKYWADNFGRASYADPPDDASRMIPANIAIRSIIDTASKNPEGDVINVGYSDGGNPKNPTIPMKLIHPDWNNGNDANRIFYVSPANSSAIDDVEYLLPFCGTDFEGPMFLRFGRGQKEKDWNLISLRDIFLKSKEEQVERLFINNVDSVFDKKQPYVPRAYSDGGNDIFNFTSSIASRILSYQFSPMVASDDKKIVNSPVHTYDFKNGMFHIVFGDNIVDKVVEKLEDFGKKGLYNFQTGKSPQILLNINQTKKQSVSIDNVFLPNHFVTEYGDNFFSFYTRNKMLKDALFLNEALSFTVHGLTIRSPGRFLFIDSLNSSDTDSFNDRFLGQWLIIKVVHIFRHNTYFSNVVATKVDSFNKLWEKEDSKY